MRVDRTIKVCGVLALVLGVAFSAYSDGSEIDAIQNLIVYELPNAWAARDLGRILSHFSEDAQIDSAMLGAKVSKAKYAETLARSFSSFGVPAQSEVRVWRVSLVDGTHATVEGEVLNRSAGSEPAKALRASHQWRLEKRDGKWLIVETEYKSRFIKQ